MANSERNSIAFDAFILGPVGTPQTPFSLRISAPFFDPRGNYYCVIDCPYLRSSQFKICGYDEAQACDLSLSFVRKRLADDGVTLVDESGRLVDWPEPPTFPDYANDRY